ncbi:hypothetical protein Agabi119p4_10341 [Agaricus bisporus var. burnettii]|uniref:BTB domain-containing protein n=1 Tax=Agaricus bisporus var. burnettii TaxID=192524 RepID=A0A8H7EWI5_AGABI|nr:hypothetical protein Agabi119p4_10341 [Agaricus bisporus var. burnettii]
MTSQPGLGDAKFHPLFNDETADIIISSNMGTLYRMHKLTLRKTSNLPLHFDDQHVLLDSSGATTNSQTHISSFNGVKSDPDITLPFPDHPIERVLSMISGLSMDPWKSFTELEETVDVIQYLDTPGPLSIVRASCLIPVFTSEPVRLYGLAVKFGWEDEAQHAAQLTFSLNLLGDAQESNSSLGDQLSKLSGTALYKLLKLHQRRRDKFRESLYSQSIFGAGNVQESICSVCASHLGNSPWRDFRSRMLLEMDQRVDCETIMNSDLEAWEETTRCFEARSAKESLSLHLSVINRIRICIISWSL